MMAAAGGAAAAGIAAAIESNKVHEEEISGGEFSVDSEEDKNSDLHTKYRLNKLELEKPDDSKNEWKLNINADPSYTWVVEVFE